MPMDCIKIQYLVTFLCVAVYVITADQQNSSSFLSNYARQQDICHKIGWEPTCKNNCQGKVIAFHAILSKRLNNVPSDTIIKFEYVEFNDGNGYNPTTGKFTAPVDGVYSFQWIYLTGSGSKVYLCGYVNGRLRAYSAMHVVSAVPWQNASGHYVAKLKKGDKFWIQNFASGTARLIHENYTYLSGYKISGC